MKNIMKQFLLLPALLLAGALLTSQRAWSQNKPWVKLNNNVLTFSYGVKPVGQNVSEVPLGAKKMIDIPWSLVANKIQRVVFTPSFRQAKNITSTFAWFFDMEKLTSITGIENLVTDDVTVMDHMFCNCKNLTSLNLSSFKTNKVTDMGRMFLGCRKLKSLDISNFSTSKVKDMESMFAYCDMLESITVSEITWHTSQADREDMFEGCNARIVKKMPAVYAWATLLNGVLTFTYGPKPSDPSLFKCDKCGMSPIDSKEICPVCDKPMWKGVFPVPMDNSKGYSGVPWHCWCQGVKRVVIDKSFLQVNDLASTRCWFSDMENLTEITGLENLRTDKITSMSSMFSDCSKLTSLDLTTFNTSNVEDVQHMFSCCLALKTIIVSSTKWDLKKAEAYRDIYGNGVHRMLDRCPAQIVKR